MINSNQLTVPCVGSVKRGDSVMIITRNGEPTAVAAVGWGDSVESDITEAADAASAAQASAESAAVAASAAQTSADNAQDSADLAAQAAASAQSDATDAGTAAANAQRDATAAGQAASAAQMSANNALSAANNAQASADNANKYASNALASLSTVQSVAETLEWVTEHGTMALTSDTALDPTHVYFVQDNSGDYVVGGVSYSVVSEPVADDLSTYYELSIDESLNNYVGTHLALTGEGLWLLPADSGSVYKVLVATGAGSTYTTAGTYIIDGSGTTVASFTGAGIAFDENRGFTIGDDAAYIYFDGAGHINIGGTGVTIGGSVTLSQLIAKYDSTITAADISATKTGDTATITIGSDTVTITDGATGATGPQGPQGATGPQGPQGEQGPQGVTGATGATGADGAAGGRWYAGTKITGTSTTAKVFSGSGISSAVVGDMYLNTSTCYTYRCTVAGAASTAKWVYVNGIKGATGAQGPQGEQGEQGATGATGPQGPQGETGATGATGPQGPQGETGATGAQGVSVSAVEHQYYLSTSNTSQAGGSWTTTPADYVSGRYYWERWKITFSDNSTAYTTATLAKEVTSAWTAIEQNQTNIALKANQTTVDSLDDRVEAAESAITVNATNISSKVSSTDYTGATIASLINQSASSVTIEAEHIDLEGAVTISDLTSEAQDATLNENSEVTHEASGTTVTVTDAASRPPASLTIYGESTQDGTPTPSDPASIYSVSDPVFANSGKNLLDMSATAGIWVNGTTGAVNSLSNGISYVVPCLPETAYTFSRATVGSSSRGVIADFSEYPQAGDVGAVHVNNSSTTSATFTTSSGAAYLLLFLDRYATNTGTNYQLELGSAATAYEPYSGTSTAIDLDGYELRSLPDGTRDELTIDANGRATLTQRVGAYDVTGTEGEGQGVAEIGDGWYRCSINLLSSAPSATSSSTSGMCSHAEFFYNTTDKSQHVATAGNYTVFVAQASTAAAITAIYAGAEIIYKLATPQTIDLGTVALPNLQDGLAYISAPATPTIDLAWWSTRGESVLETVDDAAKTATSYVTEISGGGINVHPSDDATTGVQITDDVDIMRGGTSVINIGANDAVRIGRRHTGNYVNVDADSFDLYHATTEMVHFGYGEGNASSGTANAPYYTIGTRASGSTVGNYSLAEGRNTTASGYASHAEGSGTTASTVFSHAEGYGTMASGGDSHAEGFYTIASGLDSHAEGGGTVASGRYSHVQNFFTIAASEAQTALGTYNVEDSADTYAVIVGNGTGDSARSNALTVDWDGNVVAGALNGMSLAVGGASATVNNYWTFINANTGVGIRFTLNPTSLNLVATYTLDGGSTWSGTKTIASWA